MKNALIIVSILAIAGLAALYKNGKHDKSGYIQIQKVFNDFEYKKEMEAKLKQVEEVRKKELDSLEMRLKILFEEADLNKKDASKIALFKAYRQDFLKKREDYRKDYAEAVNRYDEIILKQMNQYVKEFGEKHGYKYIFGTDGKGSLMYADSTSDITAQVSVFINEKYKGKTK